MLTAERRQVILSRLGRDGKVVASELVAALGVSEDTVRRDLRELAAGGLVQRGPRGGPRPRRARRGAPACAGDRELRPAAARGSRGQGAPGRGGAPAARGRER